jgi:transcriptional regulator
MYVPAAFQVDDPEKIAQFIADHSFATVITQHEGVPFASHVPLLFDREIGPHGTLVGHLARLNLQWQDAVDAAEGIPALAIFSGPHTYISPTWYAEPNTVPTWNYVAVHATGKLTLLTDEQRLLESLTRTVNIYESNQPQPWRLEDQDPAFIQKLLGGIVGFEIAIEKLEGKWKLNQNQSAARRERVIATLTQSNRHDDQQIANCMLQQKES